MADDYPVFDSTDEDDVDEFQDPIDDDDKWDEDDLEEDQDDDEPREEMPR